MSCRGVHFSISPSEAEALRAIPGDSAKVKYLADHLLGHVAAHPNQFVESDKAWDAMHRTLGNGELSPDGGTYPLNHVVIGGESLHLGGEWIMSLKTVAQVADIAGALSGITRSSFQERYDQINPRSYDGEKSEVDFEYTWDWFQRVRDLYIGAAVENRSVLFVVDL